MPRRNDAGPTLPGSTPKPAAVLPRLWRTLQPLPWQLHGFRVVNDLRKRAWLPVLPALVALWQARGRDAARLVRLDALAALGARLDSCAAPGARDLQAGRLVLAGRTLPFPPPDWRLPGARPLEVYQVHYLDWTDALAAAVAQDGGEDLLPMFSAVLASWRAAAPGVAKAWEPYPRARRVLACLRAAARLQAMTRHGRDGLRDAHLTLRDGLLAIAGTAACDLAPLLERHLGGNHLLVDRIALAAAEAAWGRGERDQLAAVREADAQFPHDGAHVEASPMYHALLCDDLLVLRGLMATPSPVSARLDVVLDRALGWLAAVRHPDGRLPGFGDSDPDTLDRLPLVRTALASARPVSAPDPRHSVWTARQGGHFAVVHTAPPAWSAQPGHAHADHLAVEWSCADVRVLADAGLAGYEGDPHREWNRSAASHSTLEVPGAPSIELWASFRVGARGHVQAIAQGHEDGWDWLTAAHVWPDGSLRHERLVAQHRHGRLILADRLFARQPPAIGVGRLLLAPGVTWTAGGVLQSPRSALPIAASCQLEYGSGWRFRHGQAAAEGPELRYPVGAEPVWILLGGGPELLASARTVLQDAWDALALAAVPG